MIEHLITISQKVGEVIMRYHDKPIDVRLKDDQSPVTVADKASHKILTQELRRLIDIPVLSEEGQIPEYNERKKWKRYWLIDPLDGTKEFINRNGEFTVNIALIEYNQSVTGIVYLPVKEIAYTGQKHQGSYIYNAQGKKKRIYSNKPDIREPLRIVVSRSHQSDDIDEKLAERAIQIKDKIKAGSSLKFCLLAEGTVDLYPRFGPTMEWDTAAGDAVFRYSGKRGDRHSPLIYNKPSLKHHGFIIGL